MTAPIKGQTVHEAAAATILRCEKEIRELQEEMDAARVRLRTQFYANMLESDRLAQQTPGVRRALFDECHC